MGAPIYLVSACASGEEFISAFRRYADRNGVIFIPIAEPLPAGRRGRFALALANGSVMVEGQAEVVSSAKTPSVLYGRVGMTVKFLVPDEPSQTILSELEKARTSLRPPAPSIPARPAEVPAQPRPKPPAPGGRIDAVNALAECVVIGDVSTLSRDSDLGTIPPPMGKVPSGPTPIPMAKTPSGPTPVPMSQTPSGLMSVPMAKTPSGPTPVPMAKTPSGPTPVPMAKTPSGPASTMPPPFHPKGTGSPDSSLAKPATPKPPIPAAPERPKTPSIPPAMPPIPAGFGKATSLGLPAIDRKPAAPIGPPTTVTPAVTPVTGPALLQTSLGVGARPAGATTPAPNAPPPPNAPAKPLFAAPPPPVVPSRDEAIAAALRFAQAVEAQGGNPDETVRGVAPPPPAIVHPPGAEDHDERTDLTVIPAPEGRRTEIGVAVMPSDIADGSPTQSRRIPTDEEIRPTTQMAAAEEPTNPLDVGLLPVEQVDPLGSTQAAIRLSKLVPTVEEPSGDWTMSTGDGQLTITPRKPGPEEAEAPKPVPKGPPTGDWIVALDPSRPDGWSEPSKVEVAAYVEPGPPVSAVASDKPLDSNSRQQPAVEVDEPKIQVDPTLIEPLKPMPVEPGDEDDALAEPPPPMPPPPTASSMLPLVAPPPSSQMPAQPGAIPIFQTSLGIGPPITPPRATMPTPMPAAFAATPVSPQLANASGSSPSIDPVRPRGGRRVIVVVVCVVVAIAIAVLLVFEMTGRGRSSAPTTSPTTTPSPPPPKTAPPKTEDHAVAPPVTLDAAVAETTPDAATEIKQEVTQPIETTPKECTLTITSVPSEASVAIGTEDKGSTPVTVTVPCGSPISLAVKKARYQTVQRDVTPKPNAKPLKIVLPRTTFTVKVSSSPPGATVTLNGKTLGMTPTTVKVPAFETSMLKISKDGYGAETQKVAPKNNAGAVSVTLKKTAKPTTKKLK